jgi:hypothetical protein
MEAQILEVIREVLSKAADGQASINEITRCFAYRFGDEYDRKITAKWIGSVVRRSLQLKTQKSHGIFVIAPSQRAKLARLSISGYPTHQLWEGTDPLVWSGCSL